MENTGIAGNCSPVDKYMYTYENVHSAITSAKLPLKMLIMQLTTHGRGKVIALNQSLSTLTTIPSMHPGLVSVTENESLGY